VKRFQDYFDVKLDLPRIPNVFNSNISRRGNIIHGGFVNVSISPENRILLNQNRLTKITEGGFNGAVQWVNSVYGNMLTSIHQSRSQE